MPSPRAKPRVWTAEELAELAELAGVGFTPAMIARAMGQGFTYVAIAAKAKELGLDLRLGESTKRSHPDLPPRLLDIADPEAFHARLWADVARRRACPIERAKFAKADASWRRVVAASRETAQ